MAATQLTPTILMTVTQKPKFRHSEKKLFDVTFLLLKIIEKLLKTPFAR